VSVRATEAVRPCAALARGVARRGARPLLTLLLASIFVSTAPVGGARAATTTTAPQAALEAGKLAYQRHEYAIVEQTVRPLLYPTVELGTDDAVVEARRLLALAYFFQKRYPEARAEVVQILAMRPEYQLDRYVEPPVAVSFFEAIRREQDDRLEAIRRREREEELARQREAEAKRREALRNAERVYLERTVERHSRVYAFVPFGVGQFQNGQRKKAIFFLSSELIVGALSLACWAALPAAYNLSSVRPEDAATVNALNLTQIVSGVAFWGLVLAGVIDANVKYVPTVTRTRELPTRPRARLSITPFSVGLEGIF
jgi:hypothetical protein